MARADTIVSFDNVSHSFGHKKPILDEASFTLRQGSKTTLMGQNGAGKSTILGLIAGVDVPESGKITIAHGLSIAIGRQVVAREDLELTVREFFQKPFTTKVYDIDPRIDEVLEVVNLKLTPRDARGEKERKIRSFSGGQQARLLLAYALIQDPDLLLLDEPTNNLDKAGIEHLTKFLMAYKKTCIVISHDAQFLNTFSDGVLYLDVHTHKVEQYVGNYNNVIAEIAARMERENRKNAMLAKEIQEKKDKSNFFANKGGQMRMVAKRMREKVAEMEEEKVVVRREDKTIRPFNIPVQEGLSGVVMEISAFTTIKNHKQVVRKREITLRKNEHLLLVGPNGIGKSTLLEKLSGGNTPGASISHGVRVGYYRQDFSNLNFDKTVMQELTAAARESSNKSDEERLRSVAAGFLITGELVATKIGHLSEGQKGLVAFARLVLLAPGLLILDEPTNHINFRHLPVIAYALHEYKGAMIVVSHVPDFVSGIRIDQILDLEK